MNIEQLKLFIAVYRLESIKMTAEQFNLATSSVSRSLAGLEKSLGTRLFHRTTRKVSATEEGEELYHRIAPLIEELTYSFNSLKENEEITTGKIRLTCSVSFGQIALVPLLKEFKEKHPKIELDIILSDNNLDLINERIDIAIRHGELNDSSLVIRKLMDTRYHLVASPEYLSKHPPITKPADITTHDTISFSMQELRSKWTFKKAQKIETIGIKPSLTLSNANAIRDCAKNSLGLAILADWTITEDLKNESLLNVLPDWEPTGTLLGNTVWLVFPSKSFMPKKTKILSDFLVTKINNAIDF